MALAVSGVAALAQTGQTVLPVGSELTFISEDTVDARVQPGAVFRVHLRDALTGSSGVHIADAGAHAHLVVVDKAVRDGVTRYAITLRDLAVIGGSGELPVSPIVGTVEAITTGMAIPARTTAYVANENGRLRVIIPLPFKLSNDTPQAGYTPIPFHTVSPVLPRATKRPTTPAPTTSPEPSPTASATASASATPAPHPSSGL
jgi:hypothetical protein